MSAIFSQRDFSGGLDAQLDPTKTPRNTYSLLINGRNRKNVISPTAEHEVLDAPVGNYQGLYVFGTFLLLFVDGIAYSGDITGVPIILRPVDGWVPMDAAVERIYAEQAPATNNLFNRTGTPDDMVRVFNGALAVFKAAVYCFDGINPPQAVLPDATAVGLGSYATWTQNNPLYVPIGILPAFAGAKLYVIAPDRTKVLQSVSGRPSDFVVNLAADGSKGGDADTVSQTVSYNDITCVRALSTGEVLVGTLYGTFVLVPDYSRPIFGEPFLEPRFLFPAGPVNELSIVDILQDTAFITQSGIHAFNAVAQAKRESNNFPLGAKIRTLLTDPNTGKAIVQERTCATLYDDFAFFALNTIHGYGCIVYDTITQAFQSLDLSFGQVKQFAVTKVNGSERMFFITHDNKLFEGFAGSSKNATRVLLGDWTPIEAPSQSVSYMMDAVFVNVREPGAVRLSFYTDQKIRYTTVLQVTAETREIHLPIPLPFIEGDQVARTGVSFGDHFRAWKCSVLIEWNFTGDLAAMSIDGKIETGDNVTSEVSAAVGNVEKFAFVSDTLYQEDFNTGGNFPPEGFVVLDVIKGARYGYIANGAEPVINGIDSITSGMFRAAQDKITIVGSGAKQFSFRYLEPYASVMDAVYAHEGLTHVIHGGDFAHQLGSLLEVTMGQFPMKIPWSGVPGNHDVVTQNGLYFFNMLRTLRSYTKTFEHVDFFFFNTEPFEPLGTSATSQQAGLVKNWIARSTRPFKILIMHRPMWTVDIFHYPGMSHLRYLAELPGLSAVISGHGHNMQRYVVGGFPSFVCGTGGAILRSIVNNPDVEPAFKLAFTYGHLLITADALTCRIDFKDVAGNVLDTYALYA